MGFILPKRKGQLLLLLSVFLFGFLGGCSTGIEITLDEAKMIALEDAPKFKPYNENFEIWKTEETNRGWTIMMSSNEPMQEEPSPNILYEVDKTGNILERANMALAE